MIVYTSIIAYVNYWPFIGFETVKPFGPSGKASHFVVSALLYFINSSLITYKRLCLMQSIPISMTTRPSIYVYTSLMLVETPAEYRWLPPWRVGCMGKCIIIVKLLITDPPKRGQPLYSGRLTCHRLILP